ncbi:hypothetical protein [Caulobacter segnis]|uniref:hypothetical protein n=1 Tax=Caulobacter segnis TaxID=88688 RepID=UPI00285FD418|nr:hypothetical protein [Caulobacter segnis]MDR6625307.1 hypothetical protein [Caulobacter segnis]
MSSLSERAALPVGRRFYVGMAAIFTLIAFGGFVPTYWAKLASGTFGGAPILHLHGLIFFSWTLLFLAQTWLVASGRAIDHRSWGVAGVSLATAMAFTVVLAAINSMKVADAAGFGDAARRFSVVSLTSLVMFAGFFVAALLNVRKPEVHKRLMLLAMIPPMQAATARVFMVLFAPPGMVGPPPVFVSVPPGLAVDLLIVAAMIFDWRTRGRPHPVYWIGGGLLLAQQVLVLPLSQSPAWMAFARWVESLAR